MDLCLADDIFAIEAANLNNEMITESMDPFTIDAMEETRILQSDIALMEALIMPLQEAGSFKDMIKRARDFIVNLIRKFVSWIKEAWRKRKLQLENNKLSYLEDMLRKCIGKPPVPEYVEKYDTKFVWYDFDINAVKDMGDLAGKYVGDPFTHLQSTLELIKDSFYGNDPFYGITLEIIRRSGITNFTNFRVEHLSDIHKREFDRVLYNSLLMRCGWKYAEDNGYYREKRASLLDPRKILELREVLDNFYKSTPEVFNKELQDAQSKFESVLNDEATANKMLEYTKYNSVGDMLNAITIYFKAKVVIAKVVIDAMDEINKLSMTAIRHVIPIYYGPYLTAKKDYWKDNGRDFLSASRVKDDMKWRGEG